jgi:hypothetical protein
MFFSFCFKGLARETGRVDWRAAGLTGGGFAWRMLRTVGFVSQQQKTIAATLNSTD